jgi:t-SNARE complex subunit (syntaxin)
MRIRQDSIEINDKNYLLKDLSSFLMVCNQLKSDLSPTNLDIIETRLNDLIANLALIRSSDMADQMSSQTLNIQKEINTILNNIQLMKALNQNLNTIEDLLQNLSADNYEKTEEKLHEMESSFQNIAETALNDIFYAQIQALKNSFKKLQMAIEQIRNYQKNYGYAGTVVVL